MSEVKSCLVVEIVEIARDKDVNVPHDLQDIQALEDTYNDIRLNAADLF